MGEMKKWHRKKQHKLASCLKINKNAAECLINIETKKKHWNQNYRIRRARKPIIKPDLDAIMEEALKK